MSYSYFAFLIYYLVLILILEFDILFLTAIDMLYIMLTLTVCTVFIAEVIFWQREIRLITGSAH